MHNQPDDPQRIALVINSSTGDELQAGKRDVSVVHALLTDPKFGACSLKLSNPVPDCASRQSFQNALDSVIEEWRARDQLILYFSGHGSVQGRKYCLQLGEDQIPFQNILNDLEAKSVQRAILLLDACFSGHAAGSKQSSYDVSPDLGCTDLPQGIAIVCSSRGSQWSYELEDGSLSVFTHLFRLGIEKGLDNTPTEDGKISVGEIVNYVNDKLEQPEYAKFRQRCVYKVTYADRSIWISKNPSGSRSASRTASDETVTSIEELRLLYERTGVARHPCHGVTHEHLDWETVQRFSINTGLEACEQTRAQEVLDQLQLYSPIKHGGTRLLHKSAVLCFAHEPQRFYPQSRSILLVGKPEDDIFERKEITGSLSKQIVALNEEVMKRLGKMSLVGKDGQRQEESEIDFRVVREVISNAITHRDYEANEPIKVQLTRDALEVYSPGRFPPGTSWHGLLKDESSSSHPINVDISYYLANLLVVENVGKGFAVFRQYLERNGADSITCTELPGSVTKISILRRKPSSLGRNSIGVDGDTAHVEGGIYFHDLRQIYQQLPPQDVDDATLAKGLQRLEQMPVNEIPEPAGLAPGSRIPLGPNPHFVGRMEDLRWLADTLKKGQTAVVGQVAVATGLGGIGKTQLAVEFVHRYGQFFAGGVHWVNFSDPAAIPTEISSCCPPGYGGLSLEDRIRIVLSMWQSPMPRLIVFDDCEDEELLHQWRPKTGGSRVLVTSRIGTWGDSLGAAARRLGVLSREESIALLKQYRPDMSDADAAGIAEELGDLPLALHLAGNYLRLYDVSPDEHLRQLRDKKLLDHPSLQGRGVRSSPTHHTSHVARSFALSFDRLDPDDSIDRMAISLLKRAACFAPGIPIPSGLLLTSLPTSDQYDAVDACNRLVDLGLLEEEAEGALVMHRLLALYVGEDAEAQEAVEETLNEEANIVNNSGVPTPLVAWQAHLRWVTDRAQPRLDEQAASLCNNLGFHLDTVGDYSGARPYLERALAIYEKVLGPEHPNTAVSLNNLGLLMKSMGDYSGARPYLERALATRENILGLEHPDTAVSLNNLGYLLSSMGDYEGARPYLERALAIYEKVLGPEHPDTATSLNNLGGLLDAMGDYEGARPYYKRALAIREKVLGLEHPSTMTGLNNLGGLLSSMGDYEGARPYYERALAIREKVLGPEHPDTAVSLNNLGLLMKSMGDYSGARPYLERALAIYEKVLGPEHPDTAMSLNNLGYLLSSMGDYEGARPYYERALAIYEKVLGPEHPDTAMSLNNLGYLLSSMGDYEGARPYYERALAIYEKVLGPEHPDTATSLNNLGLLLDVMGDYSGGRPYYERALAIVEKALGPEHPKTQIVRENLRALASSPTK